MLIGIMGPAGSGKDTMGDYLSQKYRIQKIALADPLKRVCKDIYRFSDTQLWGPSSARNIPDERYPKGDGTFLTPREALQSLGTEWGRNCYINTWVDYGIAAHRRVMAGEYYSQKYGFGKTPLSHYLNTKVLRKKINGTVFTDIRFRNEIEAINRAGGVVIKLKNPWAVQLTAGIQGHASEEEQKSIPDYDVDYVLDVPIGIHNYHRDIDAVLACFLPRKIFLLKG